MTENEFMLEDRIAKIKAINLQYNLEENATISFSGGKDSVILHHHLTQICKITGLSKKCIRTRYERGWSVERIINTPKIIKNERDINGRFKASTISARGN